MEFICTRHLRTLFCMSLFSVSIATTVSATNKVPLYEDLFCVPTLSYFCSNIHIGCAGQSNLRTWSFTLTMNGATGQMAPSHDQSTSNNDELTRDGEIVRAGDLESLILFLSPGKDYVKVSSTGKFNFRHYTRGGALMTYGWGSTAGKVDSSD